MASDPNREFSLLVVAAKAVAKALSCFSFSSFIHSSSTSRLCVFSCSTSRDFLRSSICCCNFAVSAGDDDPVPRLLLLLFLLPGDAPALRRDSRSAEVLLLLF